MKSVKKENNKALLEYYRVCEKVHRKFIEQLDIDNDDSYWIGSKVGGTLSFLDFFVDMDVLVKTLEMNVTYDEFSDWYYWQLDNYLEHEKEPPLNFEHFIKFGRVEGFEDVKKKYA